MDVKICDMVGFDLHWWFYGGKINGDVDRRPTDNRVNVGNLPLEDGMAEFCKNPATRQSMLIWHCFSKLLIAKIESLF